MRAYADPEIAGSAIEFLRKENSSLSIIILEEPDVEPGQPIGSHPLLDAISNAEGIRGTVSVFRGNDGSMKVNMHEAKSQLSRLGKLAWDGEEIVIARSGEPWLRLTPYRKRLEERKLGGLEDQIRISPDFDDEDEELIKAIENSKIFPDEN